MKNKGIVELAFSNLEGKEGLLWLKLNASVPFKWKKVGDSYFLDLSSEREKKWNVEEKRKTHSNAYKPWTPEDDDLLERLYSEGTVIKNICSQLGRNRGAIDSRINKLGLRDLYL
jgi:hypothetical protein